MASSDESEIRSRKWRGKGLLEPAAAGGSSEDDETSCRIRTATLDREKVGTEEDEPATSEGVEKLKIADIIQRKRKRQKRW
ncbi:hypothetical protein MTO96_026391 [Rhipicephalus appendiculatus]